MRNSLAGLLTATLALGIAGSADAAKTRKKPRSYSTYQDNSPSAIAERQRHASTFDETQYYERDSNKIPFGTAAWWRQKETESGIRGR